MSLLVMFHKLLTFLACNARKGKEQAVCDAHKTDGKWDISKCVADGDNCVWNNGMQCSGW